MSKSNAKPDKPYPDFPLFPHATGRWAKKINGKLHYFGYWRDRVDNGWQAALNLYQDQRDDLHAGRTPRANRDGLTIRDLCNRFLTAKNHKLDNGELAPRSFFDYKSTTDRIVRQFGKARLVDDLSSEDFKQLRGDIATTRGPVALGNEIQRVRSVFKYAFDARLIDSPMRYGPDFKRPAKKILRRERNKNNRRMFEATEVWRITESAPIHLKAMSFLAVNCGFGNSDCGMLPISAVDLVNGWVEFPRPKTEIERRCPLWPETVSALQESMSCRPLPKSSSDRDLFFITSHGHRWAKQTGDNSISEEFGKLLKRIELYRQGCGFYALRRTFRTIADECADRPAIDRIMGHVDDSMGAVYRVRIEDSRLTVVAAHVRTWLLSAK